MSDRSRWQASRAWPASVPRGSIREAGVEIEALDPVALATIIGRRGREADLARVLQDRLDCEIPSTGRVTFGRSCDLVWSAPGQWLAVGKLKQDFADLPATLEGLAAVTDQTDSRALVRVGGPRARDVLAKGFAMDLHPTAFAAGFGAVTKVALLSVQIWQADDVPTFVIAVPRSTAGSFWSWLSAAYVVPETV